MNLAAPERSKGSARLQSLSVSGERKLDSILSYW
jgi:hypothetical protein